MKQFQYVAQTLDGKQTSGQIQSETKKRALQSLQKKGLFIVNLKGVKRSIKFSNRQLANFTKRLHLLLQSGLPLYESLQFLMTQATKKEQAIYEQLGSKVRLGKSFSSVLQEMGLFEPLYIALIQAGEQRGNLLDALVVVSDLIEQRQKLRNDILSALSYPIFIAIFALICFYVLLLFVVPSFTGFFEGVSLPAFTKMVFALSHSLRTNPFLIPFCLGLVILGFGITKPKQWIYRLPILSSLSLQRDLFLFSKAFSHLHDADVEILTILDLTRGLVTNPKLRNRIYEMQDEIKSGWKLSESFSKLKLDVHFFVQMITVGEQSANLSGAFKQISIYFESILQNRIKRLLNFLQPIVLLIVAGFIGVVMLSILIPMTDVSRFVDL